MSDAGKKILQCNSCKTVLPWSVFNTGASSRCPSCKAGIYAAVFPALNKPPAEPALPVSIAIDGESACFHHPAKKAEIACDICGRFMCSLCHIPFGTQHLCAACIESGKKKNKLESVSNRRERHDDKVYALAVYPLIFFPLTIITAPVALGLTIWKWNEPMSILGRSTAKMVVAIVASTLQILAWLLAAGYFYRHPVW